MWEMDRGVPMYLSGYGGLMEDGHNYTFEDGSDVPQPYFNVLWSTREISFDVRTAPDGSNPQNSLLMYFSSTLIGTGSQVIGHTLLFPGRTNTTAQ